MSRASPQLICFSYHKSGTSLFLHVMTKVCRRLGLSLANHYGRVERLDPEPDVILLPHSVLGASLDRPYRAIRLIRDPRDIWVSGYLYHLRCDEEWCRNTDMDPTPPIGWPRVDYSVLHWSEDWKRHYLERLGGRPYQQNLLDRPLAEGLDFELAGYTGCTLATMRQWGLNGADALDVRLEDVMADFDGTMLSIFAHFGFSPDQSQAALEVARSEDIQRMADAAIAERRQIHSRTISKWREVLSAAQIARFEECHGDLIRELGYAAGGDARASTALKSDEVEPVRSLHNQRSTAIAKTTQVAEVWLLSDDATICPTAASQGIYTFVVPSGRRRVGLESRFGASRLGDTRRLGVRVSEIAIRSNAGEVVIAADDPSLTMGWYDAERDGTASWRWTDGSAELPWPGVSGPAVVTVRCVTLSEYLIHGEKLSPCDCSVSWLQHC